MSQSKPREPVVLPLAAWQVFGMSYNGLPNDTHNLIYATMCTVSMWEEKQRLTRNQRGNSICTSMRLFTLSSSSSV